MEEKKLIYIESKDKKINQWIDSSDLLIRLNGIHYAIKLKDLIDSYCVLEKKFNKLNDVFGSNLTIGNFSKHWDITNDN